MSRRKTLAILGGGFIAAASGATFAVTRAPDTAIAPWANAGQYSDPRKKALSYAILAPNPHNRQPWIVDLGNPDEITLYVDTDRLLPHTDPFSRQIVIGLGCFLELLSLAAAEDGLATEIELFPSGIDPKKLDARPVAHVRFATGATPDPLFQHVMERRSLKETFDTTRTVPDDALADFVTVARATDAQATNLATQVADLRQLTREALIIEIETPHTYKESVDLFRIGHKEVNTNPDGIDFSGPVFEAMHLTRTFTRSAALDASSVAFREGVKAVLANADTAMAHLWQVTAQNTRVDQIAAGRDWMRLHLAATRRGLGVQPLSQALQEYPEMTDLYAQVHQKLAPGGGTVQMLARLGYGPEVSQSPRWPLEAKIRATG
ncbi:MAG: twin-arginine translocation pathway signal protein [Boseongicola sp.]|nr:twin-arginine translocation pathway signal protein [Boseongicola sp.]